LDVRITNPTCRADVLSGREADHCLTHERAEKLKGDGHVEQVDDSQVNEVNRHEGRNGRRIVKACNVGL
jgi:hypothetical protein